MIWSVFVSDLLQTRPLNGLGQELDKGQRAVVYHFSQTEAGFLEHRGHLSLSEHGWKGADGSTDLQGDGGTTSGQLVRQLRVKSLDTSLSAKGANVGKHVCTATLWVGGVGVSDGAKDLIRDRKSAELELSKWMWKSLRTSNGHWGSGMDDPVVLVGGINHVGQSWHQNTITFTILLN